MMESLNLTWRGHGPNLKHRHKSLAVSVSQYVACTPYVLGPNFVVCFLNWRPDKSVILGRWKFW